MGLLDQLIARRRRPRPPSAQTIISRKIGKAIAAVILAGGAALFGLNKNNTVSKNSVKTESAQVQTVDANDPNATLIKAVLDHQELNFAVAKQAEVIKLLRQDNRGARHQRWIIQLKNGPEITVVHNIDLAEKVPLSVGDKVDVAGELVYGSKKNDPILHWTHADPQKRRADGYVILNGKQYGAIVQ